MLCYNLFNNRNPIYKLSTAVKKTEQNRTKLSLFPRAYSEIVVPFPFLAHLQLRNEKIEGLLLCKTTSKLLKDFAILYVKAAFLVTFLLRIWSLKSTAHLKPFLRNFFVYEKHVRYTPDWSNSSFQDLVTDLQSLFYTNHEFENRTFDWVWLIFFLFGEFDFVRLPNSIELNPRIEFDWVRLKFSSIGFDLLCRDSIGVFHVCMQ